ncbi:HTH domain-containing protein [Enterococcus villorum]|uniref:HTH domain-containing protein n=1 Tax=Enterococcus villorum TaxID=112904 RepID=UPI003F8C9184
MEIFNEFFGNEAKKEIDLLRYLYKQKRFVTIEEISQALSMDRRSIYKYYDSLVNISLTPQGNHNQIFLTKHGRGYKFVGTKTDYKVLIREILQANPFFSFVRNAFT